MQIQKQNNLFHIQKKNEVLKKDEAERKDKWKAVLSKSLPFLKEHSWHNARLHYLDQISEEPIHTAIWKYLFSI